MRCQDPILPSVLPSQGCHGLTRVISSHLSIPVASGISPPQTFGTPQLLIHHLRLNALGSPSPNLNSLLQLVLERALPPWLDAATVFWVFFLEALLFVESAWVGFECFFTFLSPQGGLGFHSVTAALSGLVTTWGLFLFSGRYQEKLYSDWSLTVSEKSQYNLAQPLIQRDPQTKLITVNFDPQVRVMPWED